MNVDCIIPAAGYSSRMKKWKLTLPYKESTIIENSIANAIQICSRVIVVTGYRSDELTRLVQTSPQIFTVVNDNFENGMFSSIQTAVPLIETNWFFITMGDMPDIKPGLYQNLLDVKNNNPEVEIVRPLYNGKRGHPVLLNKSVIKAILSEPANSEMRIVFTHHNVLDIEMSLPDSFRDIDTPEDYRKLIEN